MVEHAAVNRGVEGSSPSSGAIFSPCFPVDYTVLSRTREPACSAVFRAVSPSDEQGLGLRPTDPLRTARMQLSVRSWAEDQLNPLVMPLAKMSHLTLLNSDSLKAPDWLIPYNC